METGRGDLLLFNGCSGQVVHQATVAVTRALKRDLWQQQQKGCCGARADIKVSDEARQAFFAPLLDTAQSAQLDIVGHAPACCHLLATYGERLIPESASYHPTIRSITGFLVDNVGLATLVAQAESPLTGLRIALHATCHGDHNASLTVQEQRPSLLSRLSRLAGRGGAATESAAVEKLQRGTETASLDEVDDLRHIVTALGATVLGEISASSGCASQSLPLGRRLRLFGGSDTVAPCLLQAAQLKANMLVTPCSLCYEGLNTQQRALAPDHAARSVPVLHLSQLVGVACAVPAQKLALGRSAVSLRRLLTPYVE